MLNKTKYIFVVLAVLLVVSIVSAGRLDYPNSNRDCYGSELAPGVPVYLCFISGTDAMEASFLQYGTMHEYYTPQLKEINITGGETLTLSATPKKSIMQYGTLIVTGSPSYIYTKHI